jgi:hypothetical protein
MFESIVMPEVALKTTWLGMAAVMMLAIAAPALAGPLETARAQERAFDRAILGCRPTDALELYQDDAMAIYPGATDIGLGKNQIGPLLKNFAGAFCPDNHKKDALKDLSFAASPLGADYIMIVRIVGATDKNGDQATVRSTKVIHRDRGQWLYLIDHTSVGLSSGPASGGSQ